MPVVDIPADTGMTGEPRQKVLLFRSPKEGDDDIFEKDLLHHGYQPFSIPVLAFNFINIDVLSQSLGEWETFSAVVFTSPRSVEAADLALRHLEGKEECDKEKKRRKGLELKCYVVGAGTCKAAASCGFDPVGSECGNAEKLADFIIQDLQCSEKPILYPCGNLKRDTLSKKLKDADFRLHEVEVYQTVKDVSIEENVKKFVKKEGPPDFVVYFSPSGIKYTEDLVSTGLLPLSKFKIVAIGPTTEKELISRKIPVYGVALSPDPGGLLAALSKYP